MVDIYNEKDDDQEYVRDEECTDGECGEEQGDFVCIVQKFLCSP